MSIDLGPGNNFFFGGIGNDDVFGNDGYDVLFGNDGDDNLAGGNGVDWLDGGRGNDSLSGGANTDFLFGGSGSDTLRGDGGRDLLFGGSGADLIDGGADSDTVDAGYGNDSVLGGEGADWLWGGWGNDSVDGGAGDDFAAGEEGADRLAGGEGRDTLRGGEGNDTLKGGAGDDRLNGGDGFDCAVFDGSSADYSVVVNGDVTTVTDLNPADGDDGTDTLFSIEQIKFEIVAPNTPPDAVDDPLTIDENAVSANLTAALLSNDSDADGNALQIVAVDSTGTLGTVSFAGGVLTYAANHASFEALDDGDTAVDSFTYRISDGHGGVDTATVNVTIRGVNDAPDARNDEVAANEDGPSITGSVFADNGHGADSDPDDALAVTAVNGQASLVGAAVTLTGGGVARIEANGDFSFDPAGAYESLDEGDILVESLNYTLSDGTAIDTATVAIRIDGANDAPSAAAATFSLPENSAAGTTVGAVTASDPDAGETLSFAITGGAGAAAFTIDSVTGTITVVDASQLDFETTPSFVLDITVSDGTLTDTASVTINLTDLPETGVGPVAVDDRWIVSDTTVASWPEAVLLGNDSDADGDQLDVTAVGNGVNGTPALNAGRVTFIAQADPASFEYTLSDGTTTDTGLVAVQVVTTNNSANVIDVSLADTAGVFTYIDGKAGNDAILAGDGTDQLFGGEGSDTLIAAGGDDTLDGGAAADSLVGGSGDDSVSGGAGDDILVAGDGAGNDTYDGGAGTGDFITYVSAAAAVSVDLGAGTASGADIDSDTLSEIESVSGGAGNDVISGNATVNGLFGFDGNDTINGGDGGDFLFGENGDDSLVGGADASDDALNGGQGNDTLAGGAGNDGLVDGGGADAVFGGSGDDSITAGAGNDAYDGGDDVDSIFFLFGMVDLTVTLGALGTASGGGETDTLTAIENVFTDAGNDSIAGDGADNLLDAGAGNDTVAGSGGDDTLFGGDGVDSLVGGGGGDRFAWANLAALGDVVADAELGTVVTAVDRFAFDLAGFSLGNGDNSVTLVAGGNNAINAAGTEVGVKTDAGIATGAIQATIEGYANITTGALFVFFDTTKGVASIYYDAAPSQAGGAVLVADLANITNLAGLLNFGSDDFLFV